VSPTQFGDVELAPLDLSGDYLRHVTPGQTEPVQRSVLLLLLGREPRGLSLRDLDAETLKQRVEAAPLHDVGALVELLPREVPIVKELGDSNA
jgi:hypothetical protein